MHTDPIVPLLFQLALVLVAAKLGGELATRLRQPAVLGELIAGIAMGNLSLVGVHVLEPLRHEHTLTVLAGLGVILLLFEVGLESTVDEMRKVGASSLLVAIIGVVVPSLLGWAVGVWLAPAAGFYAHLFLGTTLCATSVGITARVLQDLGRSRDIESRIVLGAAVIDDVLGLVVLSAVSGVIAAAAVGTSLSWTEIGRIAGTAIGFLLAAIVVGRMLAPRLYRMASYLRGHGVLLAISLAVCFLLSAMAGWIGLAPIVGAFAAGLLLEDAHFKDFRGGIASLREDMEPLVRVFAPFFFLLMGMQVELATFARVEVLGLAAALTVAAILGKQACALGVLEPGSNRLAVGLGMIPRGEVGLIFAQIGRGLMLDGKPVIDDATFSAVVIMVVVTTVVTPGALSWAMNRRPAAGTAAGPGGPAAA